MSHRELPWSTISTSLVDFEVSTVPDEYLVHPLEGTDFHKGARLTGFLRALRPGVLMVLPGQFNDLALDDPSLHANAYIVPEMSYGREESQHDVQFAQLVLNSKSQGDRMELTALKLIPPQVATREYYASEMIGERLMDLYDRRVTFTNLGFYRDPVSKKIGAVSRYEHSVQSADGIMWKKHEMPSSEQVADVFRRAAQSLSDLHGEALAGHGDAQAKNIASDSQGVRLVDLEDAVDFMTVDRGVDILRAKSLIVDDLALFFTRLGGDYTDLVQDHFSQIYLERLAQSDILPEYFHPTEKEITQIARRPQEPIPYILRSVT